jgi:LemA protein
MATFQQAQGELSSALSRLLVSVEAYPDLKSDTLFENLQVQLEGTENRITTERGRYNEAAKNYNILIRTFPTNILANIFNFDGAQLFEAESGAEEAPDVDFDFSGRGVETE